MAIQVSGTSVINNSRQLQNIASLDATTTTVIAAAAGGGVDVQTFSSSGTWNKPSSGTITFIYAIGGGGGGGRMDTGNGGDGNGAFMTYKAILASNMPSSASVTVGAGGGGSNNSNVGGTSGAKSSVGTVFHSRGGTGGLSYNGGSFNYGASTALSSTELTQNIANLIVGGGGINSNSGIGGGGDGGSSTGNTPSTRLFGAGGTGGSSAANGTGLASGGGGGYQSQGGDGTNGFVTIITF